jgi:RNA polymerase sigma-70 factor, ECF subfamily
LQAVGSGDMQGLVSLLAEDVVNYADGGGKVFAARHPIVGRENVARVILGVIKHLVHGELSIEVAPINGEDAIIVYIDGKIQSVMQLENDGEKIHAIRTIVNPDKLHRVERSADD